VAKLAVILLKLAFSAVLLWYAVGKIDLSSAAATLHTVSLLSLFVAALLFASQIGLAALRLGGLLAAFGARVQARTALDVILIGSFFSQAFISFVGGDAMRVWRMTRARIPFGVAAKCVLLDRAAGFGGLLILLLVATPFLVNLIDSPEMLVGLLTVLLVAPSAIGFALLLRRLPAKYRRWKPVMLARELTDDAIALWRTRRGAGYLLGVSTAIQFLNVVILHVIAGGLGLQISFFEGFLLYPAVLFLSMLPVSFAGWGVREGAMVAALAFVGIPSYQSLALSVCYGLSVLVISLPGGAIWLATRRPLAVDAKS